MATSSAALFTITPSLQKHQKLSPSNISFHGLRPLTTTTTTKARTCKITTTRKNPSLIVTSELSTPLVISLSTGLSLFLGRFVFFAFQRENVAKQGFPEQNGVTHFEAGDTRAKEYVSLLKSNDPVGFNIIDVLAWVPLVILLLTTSWPPPAMAIIPTSLVEKSSLYVSFV